MKLTQKYGKKKIYIVSSFIAVACIVIGITTWYIMEQNYKQKVLDSIGITFVEDASIEYGTEKVDYNSFIKEKSGEPEIQLPIEEINTKELGKKQVTYVLCKDGYSKNEILDVEIKDTQFPVIEFNEETISLKINEEFDIKSNIKAIKDLVDGDITYTEDETITKDGYYFTYDIDTSIVGEYTVKLIAYDKHGNKTEKEYIVDVKEQKEINTNNGSSNANSGNKNGTQNSQQEGITTPPSNQNTAPPVSKIICPNGNEPLDPNLPCDAVTSGAWNQADPKIQFDNGDAAYSHGWNLLVNDRDYSSKYRDFTIAPCQRNDTSTFYVITPSK